jgi:hypothetical protein
LETIENQHSNRYKITREEWIWKTKKLLCDLAIQAAVIRDNLTKPDSELPHSDQQATDRT